MEIETITSNSFQIVSFSLVNEANKKKENYAVPIEQVREIRVLENITKIPKAKPYVKGVMNLRGMIIPVIDIKKRLGFGSIDEINNKKYRILIADIRDSIYGIIVDSVDQVIQISVKDIEPLSPEAFESYNYIKGIAKIQGKLVVLLDIIALLEDYEEKPITPTNVKSIQSLISSHDSQKSSFKKVSSHTTKTIDEDIPKELLEVFKEDGEEIPPKDVV